MLTKADFSSASNTVLPAQPFSLLLISHTYPPVLGGSEVEAQRVAAAMMRRGHRVQVLCAGGDPMPPLSTWVDPAGVPVRILTHRSQGRLKDITFALGVVWTLWRERKNYDAVYFLMQGLHLAAGLPVARWLRKPILMKFSGSAIIPSMGKSVIGRLELRFLAKWASRLMVLNDGMAEEAIAANLPEEKLTWMPNPVDIVEFRPPQTDEAKSWRERHNIPLEATVTIYVGRLSHEKGLPQLLRGFARPARTHPNMVLLILGDGPQRRELEALATELNLARGQIRFIGRVDLNQVSGWLRASDLFALLSPNEGFSCALVEGMASGLASVVTDIPANRQLVENGVHGVTVPFDDEETAAAALGNLSRDVELRMRLGGAARSRVLENYSTDRVIARYEALIADVLRRT